jgi:hypothetical protein
MLQMMFIVFLRSRGAGGQPALAGCVFPFLGFERLTGAPRRRGLKIQKIALELPHDRTRQLAAAARDNVQAVIHVIWINYRFVSAIAF